MLVHERFCVDDEGFKDLNSSGVFWAVESSLVEFSFQLRVPVKYVVYLSFL